MTTYKVKEKELHSFVCLAAYVQHKSVSLNARILKNVELSSSKIITTV